MHKARSVGICSLLNMQVLLHIDLALLHIFIASAIV